MTLLQHTKQVLILLMPHKSQQASTSQTTSTYVSALLADVTKGIYYQLIIYDDLRILPHVTVF